jgi:hypothetical protein
LPPRLVGGSIQRSVSPHPAAALESKDRRRRNAKDKETEIIIPACQEPPPKKERKRRTAGKRLKDEQETSKIPLVAERGPANLPASFRGPVGHSKDTPEPSSSNGSSSRPSPPGATHPPSRVIDDDYDEPSVVESLMGLSRAPDMPGPSSGGPIQSPTVSSGRGQPPSPRPSISHRDSVSSSTSRSRHSPPSRANSLKRPLSTGPEDLGDNKRSRIDVMGRKQSSPSGGRRTPLPSTRPSPIPFRTQLASHSPETRQSLNDLQPFPASPPLPAVLPPHPRPIGAGLSSHSNINNSSSINLPPIATLSSPVSTSPSHPSPSADDRMVVDSKRSVSPHSRSRTIHSRTPPTRTTPSPASSGPGQMEASA